MKLFSTASIHQRQVSHKPSALHTLIWMTSCKLQILHTCNGVFHHFYRHVRVNGEEHEEKSDWGVWRAECLTVQPIFKDIFPDLVTANFWILTTNMWDTLAASHGVSWHDMNRGSRCAHPKSKCDLFTEDVSQNLQQSVSSYDQRVGLDQQQLALVFVILHSIDLPCFLQPLHNLQICSMPVPHHFS